MDWCTLEVEKRTLLDFDPTGLQMAVVLAALGLANKSYNLLQTIQTTCQPVTALNMGAILSSVHSPLKTQLF